MEFFPRVSDLCMISPPLLLAPYLRHIITLMSVDYKHVVIMVCQPELLAAAKPLYSVPSWMFGQDANLMQQR